MMRIARVTFTQHLFLQDICLMYSALMYSKYFNVYALMYSGLLLGGDFSLLTLDKRKALKIGI